MFEGTPGPWRIFDDGEEITIAQRQEGTYTSGHICTLHVGDFNEEAKANARLIAAAPELLEAGEKMLVAFAEGVAWTAEQKAAYEAFHAAISKATGGAA